MIERQLAHVEGNQVKAAYKRMIGVKACFADLKCGQA